MTMEALVRTIATASGGNRDGVKDQSDIKRQGREFGSIWREEVWDRASEWELRSCSHRWMTEVGRNQDFSSTRVAKAHDMDPAKLPISAGVGVHLFVKMFVCEMFVETIFGLNKFVGETKQNTFPQTNEMYFWKCWGFGSHPVQRRPSVHLTAAQTRLSGRALSARGRRSPCACAFIRMAIDSDAGQVEGAQSIDVACLPLSSILIDMSVSNVVEKTRQSFRGLEICLAGSFDETAVIRNKWMCCYRKGLSLQ